MKKFLLCAFFALAMCCTASADIIPVTLSNGQIVYVDTSKFKTSEELIAYIMGLDKKYTSPQPTDPTPSVPANPSVPKK